MSFQGEYARLNAEQKAAVDQIDGPLLVIAGPGTGKTQLLSARVANILDKTDALPSNILCLTFTESGAANMRERLTRFIGRDAYDVTISTYHGFGNDIINRYRRYFDDQNLQQTIDNLTSHRILASIVDSLRFDDALKQTRHHIGDLRATIGEMKKALLSPAMLRDMAQETERFYASANPQVAQIFSSVGRLPSKLEASLPLFEAVRAVLEKEAAIEPVSERFGSLARLLLASLMNALEEARALGKPKPLTAWKNDYLEKNSNNVLILAGELVNRRLASLSRVLERYDRELNDRGLFDFDDMILKTIDALEKNDDLRFQLQEQYQYVLLDEYQDTNAAQARIVELLTNNPVSEDRPNVMAVGDDDQAIYAFQGAQYSNMTDFYRRYRDTALINLTQNYRSNEPILQIAEAVAAQIESRLTHTFHNLNKALSAHAKTTEPTHIEHREFKSPQAEYQFIAQSIAAEINEGTNPEEIAVLTPRHAALAALVPYLNALGIPVSYEKRENILDTSVIQTVLLMAELVVALGKGEPDAHLWPSVLSAPHWNLPVNAIWKLSWRINDEKRRGNLLQWPQAMLESDDERLQSIATLLLALALKSGSETSERMLDELIGTLPVECGPEQTIVSPLRDYYIKLGDGALYDMVSSLTVLRTTLRDYQQTEESILTIEDLIDLVQGYRDANEAITNTSPYAQSTQAVRLMTVFKAKGLEFNHVYLPSLIERTWNSAGESNRLTLPKNLAPTRYKASGEDENLRVFFVALTRARSELVLTSHSSTYSGARTTPLKFLDQVEEDEKTIDRILPPECATVIKEDTEAPLIETLQTQWQARHMQYADIELAGLLHDRLESFQLSPTALNKFIDVEYGGPKDFYFSDLLRFESESGIGAAFGILIHSTLEWIVRQMNDGKPKPSTEAVLEQFRTRLAQSKLSALDSELLLARGERALSAFLSQRSHIFKPTDKCEINFKGENVFIGDVHMGGMIDRMEVNDDTKTITVVDYKTGAPHASWTKSDTQLHKYRQQLYCYKLLIEGSRSFKGYEVTAGRLEFIEPDDYGNIHSLELTFTPEECERAKSLIVSVWNHVKALDFPDTDSYSKDARGMRAFEEDLIAGRV